jgi:hypothetical protein
MLQQPYDQETAREAPRHSIYIALLVARIVNYQRRVAKLVTAKPKNLAIPPTQTISVLLDNSIIWR